MVNAFVCSDAVWERVPLEYIHLQRVKPKRPGSVFILLLCYNLFVAVKSRLTAMLDGFIKISSLSLSYPPPPTVLFCLLF